MTTPRTANPARSMLAARGADESRYGFDGGLVGLCLLQHREDARFYEFRNLHRVARGGGKGMLGLERSKSHRSMG